MVLSSTDCLRPMRRRCWRPGEWSEETDLGARYDLVRPDPGRVLEPALGSPTSARRLGLELRLEMGRSRGEEVTGGFTLTCSSGCSAIHWATASWSDLISSPSFAKASRALEASSWARLRSRPRSRGASHEIFARAN